MSNELKTKTNFVNFNFSVSKNERDNIFNYFKISNNYFKRRETERKKFEAEINNKGLDFDNVDDLSKIYKLEESIFKNTIYKRNSIDGIFIEVSNMELYESINDKHKILLLNVKKGKINYNPDFYNTYLGKKINSNKTEFYIDDLEQEILLSFKYNFDGKKYTIYGTISYFSNPDLLIKKDDLSDLLSSVFEKCGGIESINMNYFEIAYSSSRIVDFIKNPEKIEWLKYKAEPKDMFERIGKSKRGEISEFGVYADVTVNKTAFNKIVKDLDIKDVLKELENLKDIRIKTEGGLIKDDEFRHQVISIFNIDSKFNFSIDDKKSYRKIIKDNLVSIIKYSI